MSDAGEEVDQPRGKVLPLRSKTSKMSGRVGKDPIAKDAMREEVKVAVTPPPPPVAAMESEGYAAVSRMMAAASEAGIQPGDPMHTLVETMGVILAHSIEVSSKWGQQVEQLSKKQGEMLDAATGQAKARIEQMTLSMVEDLKAQVGVEIGRSAMRLPLAVGRLRLAVTAAAVSIVLVGGLALGYSMGGAGVRSEMAADAGAPWSATWMGLRRWNNIDAAIAASACFYTADGRKACRIPLYVEEAKPKP